MALVTVRELSNNTAEVLRRVEAGETIEVTRRGTPVAVLRAPDAAEALISGLRRRGVITDDWEERNADLVAFQPSTVAVRVAHDLESLRTDRL